MVIDVGTNLTTLGTTWLIFHYLLPYIIGFILIGIAIVIGILFYNRIQGLNLSRDQILWGIIGAGLIAILFIVR
jgi:hypothetical protein